MVIGIQLAAIYFGAFDVDRISKIQTKKPQHQSEKRKIEKIHHEPDPIRENKRNYWFEPAPVRPYEWGLKAAPEEFNFGDYEEIKENFDIQLVSGGFNDRIKRPPSIIGAGAKKCGTIAFSTFLALNKQVLMTVLMA